MSLINSNPEAVVEDKENIEQEFLSFLKTLDYPEDSIFRGPSFPVKNSESQRTNSINLFGKPVAGGPGGGCYADLAILDLEGRQYASLVEFRLHPDEQIEVKLATMFQAIFDYMQTKPPVFLVVPSLAAGFRIHQLRENNTWQELPKDQFPHYATLTANLAAEKALAHEVKQARDLNRFTIACHLLAGIIGLITVASITGLSVLTAPQMSLLILASLLVIAPYALGFHLSSPKGKLKLFR